MTPAKPRAENRGLTLRTAARTKRTKATIRGTTDLPTNLPPVILAGLRVIDLLRPAELGLGAEPIFTTHRTHSKGLERQHRLCARPLLVFAVPESQVLERGIDLDLPEACKLERGPERAVGDAGAVARNKGAAIGEALV